MPARSQDEIVTVLAAYTRKVYLHGVLHNLQVDVDDDRYKSKPLCRSALATIAEHHPNMVSLAIDSYEFEDDDNEEAQHPQWELLPDEPEGGTYTVFPPAEFSDLGWSADNEKYFKGVEESDDDESDDATKLAEALQAIKSM